MTTDGHKFEHRVALEGYQLVSRSELRLTLKGLLKASGQAGRFADLCSLLHRICEDPCRSVAAFSLGRIFPVSALFFFSSSGSLS